MASFYSEKWGMPTQPHKKGQELYPAMQEAYISVSKLLGANEQDNILFTSSSAEAIQQAIWSTYEDVTLVEGKNHFISLSNEELPTLLSLQKLQKLGCPVTLMKPDSHGLISTQALIEAITPRTALLVISWGNGLTGVVQPMEEIAKICQLRGIRLLVDGTHVVGKLFFEIKDMPIDFLAFNGMQLHGPQGIGGLYVHQGVKMTPWIEQNIPGMVALGVAAKQALEARDYLCTEVVRLKLYFEKEVRKLIPDSLVIFQDDERVPHVSAMAFPGIVNESLLFLLNQSGVYASMGAGNGQQLKQNLELCSIDPLVAVSALSFSLSRETTEEEIDRAISYLVQAVAKLRKASLKIMEKA